jgi:hypothetical protein
MPSVAARLIHASVNVGSGADSLAEVLLRQDLLHLAIVVLLLIAPLGAVMVNASVSSRVGPPT